MILFFFIFLKERLKQHRGNLLVSGQLLKTEYSFSA